MEEIIFAPGSVPVAVVARVYGKDASWVRAGIISGWLPIGKATRNGKLITNIEEMNSKYGRINFYISPKRLWEETGYLCSIVRYAEKNDTLHGLNFVRRLCMRVKERRNNISYCERRVTHNGRTYENQRKN